MKDQIFIINNNQLTELNESEFGNEDQFQSLLENYPNLISGKQIDPDNPRKWLLIDREAGIPDQENGSNIWSIDHLFIDQDGIPTLVEVKRSTDTRIRREVVGQMLDYAANAMTYWSIDDIKEKFQSYCESNNTDSEERLADFLEYDKAENQFWDQVDTNLQAGKVRMLFVADKLPRQLIRIIEFLNEQMDPAEVLGLELRHFQNDSLKTLVPRIVGKTSVADIKKEARQTRKWDLPSVLDHLELKKSETARNRAENIANELRKEGCRLWFGTGKNYGSIVPVYDTSISKNQLFAIYSDGKIEIYFMFYNNKEPFTNKEKKLELLSRLNQLGLDIPDSKISGRPNFDIDLLGSEKKLNAFIDIYKWFIEEVKNAQEK